MVLPFSHRTPIGLCCVFERAWNCYVPSALILVITTFNVSGTKLMTMIRQLYFKLLILIEIKEK